VICEACTVQYSTCAFLEVVCFGFGLRAAERCCLARMDGLWEVG